VASHDDEDEENASEYSYEGIRSHNSGTESEESPASSLNEDENELDDVEL